MSNLLRLAWYNWLCSQRRAMMQFIIYIQPIFLVILYGLSNPYTALNPEKAFWFVVINASLLNIWSINVFSTISDIHRDRWTGMLDVIRLSITPLVTIFSVRALTNTFHGIVSLLLISSLAWLLHKPKVMLNTGYEVWLLLLVAFLLIAGFSLLFAALVAMSAHSRHIMNFIEYPVFIVAGIGFTIGLLPPILQLLAVTLPFGFMAELTRSVVGISLETTVVLSSVWGLPFFGGGVILLFGFYQMRLMSRKLAESGSLL